MSLRQPLLIPILFEGREVYQLVEEWSFVSMSERIAVPKGFICDGASIPRLLWMIRPPDGIHRAAAVAHDWLYANKGFGVFTRKKCDLVFLDLLKAAGVSWLSRKLMYRGVRLGGWVAWSKPKRVTVEPMLTGFGLTGLRHVILGDWEGHLYSPA